MVQQAVQTFHIHGYITQQDGQPLLDVIVRAYDRDLRREVLLGMTRTDQNGEYTIHYTIKDFIRPEKDGADLLVRAFKPEGMLLAVSETLFNAPAEVTLDLVVQPQTRPSEYEEYLSRLVPHMQDLSPADLTGDDIDFLAPKTNLPKESIELVATAARLAREIGLPAEAFYGWARQKLPLELHELLAAGVEQLMDTLKAAIQANIIPASLSDTFAEVEDRLRDLRFERGVLRMHQFAGRLLDEVRKQPLAGFTIRAFDLEDGPTPQFLGFDVTNAHGLFAIDFPTGVDVKYRRLRLQVVHPSGQEIYQTDDIQAETDQTEVKEIHVPVPAESGQPALTLEEVARELNLELPEELRVSLAKRKIENLAELRRNGGLRWMVGLPVAPDHRSVRVLDALANLSLLSDDLALNNTLVENDFSTIPSVAYAPRTRIVNLLADQIGEFKAAQLHARAQAQVHWLNNVATEIRVARANGFALPDLAEMELPGELVGETCRCRDCEVAVSPQAYLADLLDYTVSNLKDNDEPVPLGKLKRLFHQPFGELPATCEERNECQVRLAIEVLRRFLIPEDQAAADTHDYLERTYTALLSRIGTSYEGLRLARAGEPDDRQALAERLGIQLQEERPDQLDALLIEPDAITEQSLERLFGLVDTARDPLSGGITLRDDQGQITRWNLEGVAWGITTDQVGAVHLNLTKPRPDQRVVEIFRDPARTQLLARGFRRSDKGRVDLLPENLSGLSGQVIIAYQSDTHDISFVVVPNFLSWRLQYLRAQWRRQDRPEVESATANPLIDPDLIGPEDLRDALAGTPAFDLWLSRRDALITRKGEIKTALESAESELAGLNTILANAGVPAAALLELAQQREQGQDIRSQLQDLKLDIAAFDYLLRIHRLIQSNPSPNPIILDSEWNDVYDILVQVFKRGQFPAWREAERALDLTLGPDSFRIPPPSLTFPPPEPPLLPGWRASEAARRAWQQTLQSRIEQEQSIINALQEAVRATEAETLPILRDALAAGKDDQGLSDRLLIDFQADGCQRTTRLGLAIETIQLLLWSVRTGQLADTHPKLSLPVDNFDEVWPWLGSYATWRAAMLVFLYPENILLPSLRRVQTPAFKQLVQATRDNTRLTPGQACRITKAYSDYFQDVCTLRLAATCQTRTRIHTGEDCRGRTATTLRDLFYMFAQGGATDTVYWSAYDPKDETGYAQTFWEPVPGLESEKVVNILGAVPYEINPDERYIFLFVRAQGDGQKLLFTRYSLQEQHWTGDTVELEVPDKAARFSAVVEQRTNELETPYVVIKVEGGNTFGQRLNAAGTNWANADIRLISADPIVSQLLALIGFDGILFARRIFFLFVATADGEIRVGPFFESAAPDIPVQGWKSLGTGTWIGAFEYDVFEMYAYVRLGGQVRYGRIRGGDVAGNGTTIPLPFTGPTGLASIAVANGHDPELDGVRLAYRRTSGQVGLFHSVFTQRDDDQLNLSPAVRITPLCNGPFDIPDRLSQTKLQFRRTLIQFYFESNEDGPQSNRTYLEEAYYFVPMLLAMQLQQRGHYTQALDRFRTVYDYSVLVDRRKIYYGLRLEESLPAVYERGEDWLLDPLNPHAIAATRRLTYTRFTLLSLVRCFLDFADAEFTRDTAKSVANARTLYTTAQELLDSRDLRQSHQGCDQLIAEIVIEIGEAISLLPEWPVAWDEIKASLNRIPSQKRLAKVISSLRAALEGSEPARARLAQARQIVKRAAAETALTQTMEELVGSQQSVMAGAHTALLVNPAIASAVGRVGAAADSDFAQAVSLISGVSETTLAETRVELPWLRQTMTDGVPAIAGDGEAGMGAAAGMSASLDGNNPLAPTHLATVAGLARAAPLQALWLTRKYGGSYVAAPSFTFCVSPNPVLAALRMQVALNLYKIRTCRNIAGDERQLEPYAAPTNPQSNLPAIGAGGQLILPGTITFHPTPYRYGVLIERAKQLVNLAQQIEAAFLSILEKRDAEYYQRLKAQQDIELTRAGVRLQESRVKEAEDGVTLAELQRERAGIQHDHFQGLLEEGLSGLEIAALVRMYDSLLEPDSISVSIGLLGPSADVSYSPSGKLQTLANILSTQASYERRRQDWELQRDLAQQDLRIGTQQIRISQDQVRVVGQERAIAQLQSEHAEATADFLANKFTNVELYDWMSDVLKGVYSFFLQQATAIAQLAASQLAFERQQVPPPFIQADYWEAPLGLEGGGTAGNTPDRRGLTGSARLLQDIFQLDQYAFNTNKRKLQLTRTISLAQLAPAEFQRFRETGVMTFAMPMEMFDRDFPGHYLRLIHKVRTSVIALIPPMQGIRAALSNAGLSRVVVGGDTFQTVVVHRPPDSVALSSPREATGLFELEPQSEMLLPFEGLGVDTTWELRLPKAANLFDYRTIADVLVTIEYTALDSFDYRQQVLPTIGRTLSADRPFSFRNQFADAWYDLHHPSRTATPMTVRFTTVRDDFPANIEALSIQHMVLYFARTEGQTFEVSDTHLHFTEQGNAGFVGGGATSVDGIISTRRGNAGSWSDMIGKSPFGEWELALPNTAEIRNHFKDEQMVDVLFVITYAARTPEWPA